MTNSFPLILPGPAALQSTRCTMATRGVETCAQHIVLVALVLLSLLTLPANAQPPAGRRGPGHGPGADSRHVEDHQVLHFLLANHRAIRRRVEELPNGVATLTESDDQAIATKIKEHVRWMEDRLAKGRPIRMRDPLFRELFRHADQIEMQVETTDKGVRVVETADDPHVVALIQAHAHVVSQFVARGYDEARKNHAVPTSDAKAPRTAGQPATIYPSIESWGKVVRLPNAAQQPRSGSKLVVDVTMAADARELNPALVKLCRFVNIYAGAGKSPADVRIAAVLHGQATLAVLNAEAYEKRFGIPNPNLECLQKLHEADVEILVCGQSLLGKGAKSEEVVVFADVAVSALTSLVNLQADGYAYVPLK